MRITKLEAIPVRVPLKAGMVTKTAHGDHHTSDYVIVKLHTDDGLVGLGEATVSALWSGETSKSCVATLADLIGPALMGADPTQISALRKLMDFLIKLNPFTKAAVEMALWDIAGKARGVPVYQLLGGKFWDIIPTKMMIGAFDLPRVRSLAEQFLGWGVRCLKVKVGLDLAGDLARVKAVRDVAGPDIPITIDANCGWNVTTARIALERLRPFNILVAEQPIAAGDTEAMASLRSARHSHHGRRKRVHTRRRLERFARPRGRRGQHLSRQERRHRRGHRDRARRPGGRSSLPCWQQPRARHRLGGDAPSGVRSPEYR